MSRAWTALCSSALLAAALALLACGNKDAGATAAGKGVPADWSLESHEVPEGQREQIRILIAELLTPHDARVRLAPDGRLLVMAPRELQKEVRQVLAPLQSAKLPPTPAAIRIQYWFVHARPGDGSKSALPPELAVAGADIRRRLGQVDLELIEQVRVAIASGGNGEVEGRSFRVFQNAAVAAGRVVGDVAISGWSERTIPGQNAVTTDQRAVLKARVSLAPGEITVLADSGLPGLPRGTKPKLAPDASSTLLLIVKAELEGGK